MKIIYMFQYFNTPDMPGSTRSYEFGRRLAAKGHRVEMITSDHSNLFSSKDWVRTTESGINVHWAPVAYSNKLSFYQRIRAFFRFAFMATSKAATLDGDVIFASSTPLTIAFPGVRASKKKKKPMVFEVRDLWPQLPIAMGVLKNPVYIAAAKWLEKYAYRHSSRIVALCPGIKEGIVKTGYPADKIKVIPNSCDFGEFDIGPEPGKIFRAKHEWLKDRPLVTYTGTIGLANNIEYIVHLAKETLVAAPDICYLVMGSGGRENAVRALAEEYDVLNRNFFMLPSAPKKDIPAVFSASTLPIVTLADYRELWDNSSNKFFDALASKKPVAINYGGWEADAIKEYDCGTVLDPKSSEMAARNIIEVIRNKTWLAAAGSNAGKLGKDRFDRDALTVQMEEWLMEATNASVR